MKIRGVPLISRQVVAGDYAFVGLNKAAGTIRCWGFGLYGGVGGRCRFRHLHSKLIFDRPIGCYAAVLGGRFPTSDEGDCSGVSLTGITDVYTNGQAFLALNRNSGQGEPLAFLRELGRVSAFCGCLTSSGRGDSKALVHRIRFMIDVTPRSETSPA